MRRTSAGIAARENLAGVRLLPAESAADGRTHTAYVMLLRRHMQPFHDRKDAGRQLAERLRRFAFDNPIVLALPRGGVPVAREVARVLRAPLEVFVVRKLGAPRRPELGIGALAEEGTVYVDDEACSQLDITFNDVAAIARREKLEIARRVRKYRGGRPLPALADRTVIVVDDGLATGGTARAAVRALRAQRPRQLVLAVPVASVEAAEKLTPEVDELVALIVSQRLVAVGEWYEDFAQLDDGEVLALLAEDPRTVRVPVVHGELVGDLVVPPNASGLVLFAHGSGSSRLSPRNRQVAAALQRAGLGTLLIDLLTADEAELRSDLPLLARRLVKIIDWLAGESALPLGCFGASTGAAAALMAAAARPERVQAVVSRGGRPDLAGAHLYDVSAPALFIVGGNDPQVLDLNHRAIERLRCERRLEIVPGATHLFEEPGALDRVAELAAQWFTDHLVERRAELSS
jgi:predicted phosphoribosyltransferase/dienelactone hydrolase